MSFFSNVLKSAANLFLGDEGKKIVQPFFDEHDSNEARKAQMADAKELMGLQNTYNVEAAARSQQYKKEMWDYTNYENQLQHMMNAGLSPGLMYGLTGGGGVSAGGADQQGVSGQDAKGVGMGLQAQNLNVQKQLADSQTQLNESAAEKNKAEAKEVESRIPVNEREVGLKESQIALNKSQAQLNATQENLVKADIKLSGAQYEVAISQRDKNIAEIGKIIEEMIKTNAEGRLTNEQANWYGKVMANEIAMKTALTAKAYSDMKVNDQQMQNMQKDIERMTNDIIVKRMDANTARFTAEESAKNWMKQNDLRGKELEQRVTEMWVDGALKVYQTVMGVAGNVAGKLAGGI